MTPHSFSLSMIALLAAILPCIAAPETPDGFALPQAGRQFEFPRDHGSHPEFKLEWWYLTGHLFATNGARFGLQATFFRRAAPSANDTHNAASANFGHHQLFLAHMALLDTATGKFIHQERLNRGGWDAVSATNTLDVCNGNWSLRFGPDTHPGTGSAEPFALHGTIGADARFTLRLTPTKPLVVFGADGVSRKAAERTAASHYLTFPRLAADGTITLEGQSRSVTGEMWMDHEISSSQLGEGQIGWDWVCIQLRDGRELMAYRMRRVDGSTDPFSTLAWIGRDGRVQHLGPDRFTMTPTATWRSPVTGAEYPSRIRLTTRDLENDVPVTFFLEPLAVDQELTGALGGIPYWEGACRVRDTQGREIGSAFLELTGYAGSLKQAL